jgi:hypothetical protein
VPFVQQISHLLNQLLILPYYEYSTRELLASSMQFLSNYFKEIDSLNNNEVELIMKYLNSNATLSVTHDINNIIKLEYVTLI